MAEAKVQLSEFQKFVFTTIAPNIENMDCNLYDLVKNAINHKDVSSQLDDLIMETCDAIYNYMFTNGLATELKEKRLYMLTSLGKQLKELNSFQQIDSILIKNE